MQQEKLMVCLDIGGTNLRIGAVKGHTLIDCEVMPSVVLIDHSDPIQGLAYIIKAYLGKIKRVQIDAVSIGVPASICKDRKTVYCAPNLLDRQGTRYFDKVNIADNLREIIGVPVFVNKDVYNILYYDILSNHLEDLETVIGGYIGTGFGGAVFLNGKILRGKDGGAMEIGHVSLYHNSAICNCGKKSCLESVASGQYLQKLRQSHFPETNIQDIFIRHSKHLLIEEFLYACSMPFAMLATIFDPNVVIIGGGVSEMLGFPRERFEHYILENTSPVVASKGVKFLYSPKKPEKGILGAAYYAKKMMQNDSNV